MISHPKKNRTYQVWYRKNHSHLPLHGKTGKIVISSKGKPRNHGIMIDGEIYVVPCGNIRKIRGGSK